MGSFCAFFYKIYDILDEVNDRFVDFDFLKAHIKISNNPIKIVIESHLTFSKNYANCNLTLFSFHLEMSVMTHFLDAC